MQGFDQMNELTRPTAIVIGASSGIGEALARQLSADGWRLGLLARRLARLEALAAELGAGSLARRIDLAEPRAAAASLQQLIDELGGADLVIVSSGTGQSNPHLDWPPDEETLTVNVLGFAATAQVAMRHFLARGRGHLVGISSIAALRVERANGTTPTQCRPRARSTRSAMDDSVFRSWGETLADVSARTASATLD